MRYPPIYHIRCAVCHASSLAVGGFDPRYACPTCARLDLAVQVDWPRPAGWMVIHVFAKIRTPWLDAPGYPERLFPVSTPAGFLESLAALVNKQDMTAIQAVRTLAPGLSHQITWSHTPWCPGRTEVGAACDEQCREAVTYARVAAAPN